MANSAPVIVDAADFPGYHDLEKQAVLAPEDGDDRAYQEKAENEAQKLRKDGHLDARVYRTSGAQYVVGWSR